MPSSNDTANHPLKRCSKCGQWKVASIANFSPNKNCKLGLNSQCRECWNRYLETRRRSLGAQPRKLYAVDADGTLECSTCHKIKAATRQFFIRNASYPSGFNPRCRECINDYRRRRRAALGAVPRKTRTITPDGLIECTRCHLAKPCTSEFFRLDSKRGKFCTRCRDCEHQRSKEYYAAHRNERRDYAQHRHKRSPQLSAERMRRWRGEHPERAKVLKIRRRAREHRLPDRFTGKDWSRAVAYFSGCCATCGRPAGLWHTLAADHWIPLADIEHCPGTIPTNIIPLCHGIDGCNNSKGNRDPVEWLTARFGARKAKQILKRIEAYFASLKDDDNAEH